MNKLFFNIIDVFLLCYGVIVGFYLYMEQTEFIHFELAKWILFLLCYVIMKRMRQKQWCLYGIILIGGAEAGIAIGQKIHLIKSFHHVFDVTGTFGNPGPLGGYLAIAIIVLIGLYREYWRNFRQKWILLAFLILFSTTLVLTESRAGCLAMFAGIGSLYLFSKKDRKWKFAIFQKLGTIILVLLFIVVTYYCKKDSADGRLLIWRVSSEMIMDAPFIGHGIGTFEKRYMYYQAQYFNAHPNSQYARLADNISYPYNEFLRIGVEFGLIGLFVVLGLIISVFKYASVQGLNKIYLATFTSWLTFSMFSYPSHVLLLWLLVPFLLGGIQCRKNRCVSVGYKFQIVECMIIIICLFFIIRYGCDYYLLKNNIRKLCFSSTKTTEEATDYVERHRLELQSIPHLFDIYAQYCYKNYPASKRIIILKQATTIVPTSDLYCDLGDTYKELNQIDKAIESYILASNMVPHRILPNYKLFCLYREVGDTVQMLRTGLKALNTEVKVESTKTLRMKGDIKKTLKE